MINLAKFDEVDSHLKFRYKRENGPLQEDRLSLLKVRNGWQVPDVFAAVREGRTERVRELLFGVIEEQEPNNTGPTWTFVTKPKCVDRKDRSTGRSLLHEAATFGRKDVMFLLVNEFRADINVKTNIGGDTPLHLAAMRDHRAACFWLLTALDADPNIQNKYGWIPLHYAALYGSKSTIKTLVQYGSTATALNHAGKTPSDLANERGASEDILDFFGLCAEAEARAQMAEDLEAQRVEMEENAAYRAAVLADTKAYKEEVFLAARSKEYRVWKRPPTPEPPPKSRRQEMLEERGLWHLVKPKPFPF
mmetsp:Transcript_31544/g.70886  ORF Transcript_31544/g.70886 Transcript_31544/m.70886 type:complete len:306 (-) Transcript_31544:140-1057(-)